MFGVRRRGYAFAATLLLCLFVSAVAFAQSDAWRSSTDELHRERVECEDLFAQSHYASASRQGRRDPCFEVQFYRLDAMSGDSEWEVLGIEPRYGPELSAEVVRGLIADSQGRQQNRYIELRFENITVRGTLDLVDVSTSAKIVFNGVNFVEDDPTDDAASAARRANDDAAQPAYAPRPSIHINRSLFRESLIIVNSLIRGDIIVEASRFEQNLDVRQSDLRGDMVIANSTFARDLDLGQRNIVRGQIVLEGIDVTGDLGFAQAEFIDTLLERDEPPTSAARGEIRPELRTSMADAIRAAGCTCFRAENEALAPVVSLENVARAADDAGVGSEYRPTSAEGRDELRRQVADACRFVANLPRCPILNGSAPLLIEFANVDVTGSLAVTNLKLESHEARFILPKSSDSAWCARHPARPECAGRQRNGNEPTCPSGHVGCVQHSSLERLGAPEVGFANVSVGGTGTLQDNVVFQLSIKDSDVARLHLDDNLVNRLSINDNSIGALSIRGDTYLLGLYIDGNMVERKAAIDGPSFGNVDDDTGGFVYVTDNSFNLGLKFAPYGVTPAFAEAIDLSGNRVDGDLELLMPMVSEAEAEGQLGEVGHTDGLLAWTGDMLLANVSATGALDIQLGIRDPVRERLILSYPKPHDASWLMYRSLVNAYRDETIYSTTCSDDGPKLHFNLSGAQLGGLVWNLPTLSECFTWSGIGLRYGSWGPPDLHVDGYGAALRAWSKRYQVEGTAAAAPGTDGAGSSSLRVPEEQTEVGDGSTPADPLYQVSTLLEERGQRQLSRDDLARAKRADFGSDEWLWPWQWGQGGERPLLDDVTDAVYGVAASILFFPTNYGTKPERALLILAIVFFASWLLFGIYRVVWREDWPQLIDYRDRYTRREEIKAQVESQAIAEQLGLGQGIDTRQETLNVDDLLRRPEQERNRLNPVLDAWMRLPSLPARAEPIATSHEILHVSGVPGFMQYDRNRQPQNFALSRLALDATIPVIDLHAYNQYYPLDTFPRVITMVQHVLGWYILTSLLASMAIL